jgi:hypothetical protein
MAVSIIIGIRGSCGVYNRGEWAARWHETKTLNLSSFVLPCLAPRLCLFLLDFFLFDADLTFCC